MANTAQGQKNRKPINKLILALGLILVIVIVVAAVFAMRTDGTEQFTGVKQGVAKKALSFEEKSSSIDPMPSYLRQLHVDEVRPIRADEKAQYCDNPAYISDDPTNAKHYAAVISIHTLLGSTKTTTQYACKFLQFDEGYLQ